MTNLPAYVRPMSTTRLYSDKEISTLLKRAVELQPTQGPTTTTGLSLAELEQIAAEVGIDPGFLKAAALELEEGDPDETFHLLGASPSIDLERIVEGEMTEEKWDEAVGVMRRSFGTTGETGQVGRTREWILRDQPTGFQRVHITASPLGKQTRIRVNYSMTDWAWVVHGGFTAMTIAPILLQYLLLNLGPFLETGIALFILAALFMIARLTFGSMVRKKDRKARKLLVRLDELLIAEEAGAALPDGVVQKEVPEASRIDATLLSDDDAQDHVGSARRLEREEERRRQVR